jgi:hypothetical protein
MREHMLLDVNPLAVNALDVNVIIIWLLDSVKVQGYYNLAFRQ